MKDEHLRRPLRDGFEEKRQARLVVTINSIVGRAKLLTEFGEYDYCDSVLEENIDLLRKGIDKLQHAQNVAMAAKAGVTIEDPQELPN